MSPRRWSGPLLGLGLLLSLAAPADVSYAADCVETSPAEAQAAIEDARRAILTLEYAPTLAKLEEVRRSLECLTGTLPTETLAQLYFYQGVMKLYLEDAAGARQALEDAAAVMPLLAEEREHSTQVRELWATARDAVTKSPGTLAVPDLPKEAVAYVDGRPLETGATSVVVYPGVHLLQVWGDDRRLHGTLLRARAGETSMVPAEFLASLTPRGELVFDVSPRGAHAVVRQGKQVQFEYKRLPRRLSVPDVKEGAYVVEIDKPGFYPWSQGKVAVEGGDQTHVDVQLKRRPGLSVHSRAAAFWISGVDSEDIDPVFSLDLTGRLSSGWGFHLEHLYHVQYGDGEPGPAEYVPNPDYQEITNDAGEVIGREGGPEELPVATTVGLKFGARTYLGVTRQFRVEVVDVAVGAKVAMNLYRASAFGEVSLAWNPLPWVGVDARAGIGPMIHVHQDVYDKLEEESMADYLRVGLMGMVGGGLRVGF